MSSKKIALLDWDNSMRAGWVLFDWAARLKADGLIPSGTLTRLESVQTQHRGGLLSYSEFARLAAETFARGLRDVRVSEAESHAREFVLHDPVGLFPFAKPLLAVLRKLSVEAIVVSGAPSEILNAMQARYDLRATYGTSFHHAGGVYSGSVDRNRALKAEKQAVVAELLLRDSRVVLAVGDSEPDLPLLRRAELSIVIDNPALAALIPRSVAFDSRSSDIDPLVHRLYP